MNNHTRMVLKRLLEGLPVTGEEAFTDQLDKWAEKLSPTMTELTPLIYPAAEAWAPSLDTPFYFPAFTSEGLIHCGQWQGNSLQHKLLLRGLVHLTRDNAVKHAIALITAGGGIHD